MNGPPKEYAPVEITATSQPLKIFAEWMQEAERHPEVHQPTAMSLATQGADGDLHARVVLCKEWTDEGFVFYTNYTSRKGLDLQHHPRAAAVFYWDPLFKQVKISGPVTKTSRLASEDYWKTRPRDSQISQTLSRQSQEAPEHAVLERMHREAELKFKDREIPCPENWGGYTIHPERIEFWIGRAGRLHERYEFIKSSTLWTFRRLYP